MYYVNHAGGIVRFDGEGMRIAEGDLRNYDWSFDAIDNPSGLGGRVARFSRAAQVKNLTVVARGKSAAECKEQLNTLHALTEADIYAMRPGRFYLGGQYLVCYLGTSSSIAEWDGGYHYAKKDIRLIAEQPWWYAEETKVFRAGTTEAASGKGYNHRYPYRYGSGYANTSMLNDHYIPTPIMLTVFGPCANPTVGIADTLYGVESNALQDERIVLDQVQRKIYKVSALGAITNLFDYRLKEYDPFKPVPPGESKVIFNGSFTFEVILMKQRSEPKWT